MRSRRGSCSRSAVSASIESSRLGSGTYDGRVSEYVTHYHEERNHQGLGRVQILRVGLNAGFGERKMRVPHKADAADPG